MPHLLSRLAAPFARSTYLRHGALDARANESTGHSAKPSAPSSSPHGTRPHAGKPSAQGRTAPAPVDPWHTLLQQPNGTEQRRIARHLSRLSPATWALEDEHGQRGKLAEALNQSQLACFDIRQFGTRRTTGPQFSASVHPTPANIENFVDQLYRAGTRSVVNLAQKNEYDIEDPVYYDTGHQTIEIGDYLVSGGPVGTPVPLGTNTPSGNDPAQDITLRFYEATIVPKGDADNPAAVHSLRAFEVDNLRDGTAFEPGQLAKLAMHVLKAGGSRIHVHCHGGFDRTGMTVALSRLIDKLLRGTRVRDPIAAVKQELDIFRGSRGEWSAVRGTGQLEALLNEAVRVCNMPLSRLKALYAAIPALGVEDASGGTLARNARPLHRMG